MYHEMEHNAVFSPCLYSLSASFSCNSGKLKYEEKEQVSRNTFLSQNFKGTLDERLWKSPCLSDFRIITKVTGASSQHAMSHVREPQQCQAAVHHDLAEVPCGVTYFFEGLLWETSDGWQINLCQSRQETVPLFSSFGDGQTALLCPLKLNIKALNVL